MQSINDSSKPNVSIWWKSILTILLLAVVLSNIDGKEILNQLTQLPAGYAAPPVAIVLFLFVLGAWRWLIVARANHVNLDFYTAVKATGVAHFFNQALPATIGGDIYRIWVLTQRDNAPDTSLACVAADRLIGACSLAIVVCAGQFYFVSHVATTQFDTVKNYAWIFVVILLTIALIGRFIVTKKLENALFGVLRVFAHVENLFRHPRELIGALLIGSIGNLFIAGIFFVLAKGLDISITVVQAFVIFPAVFLLSMIPITIAGWGLREAFLVTALNAIGTPPSSSVALGIAVGLVMFTASLPGAVIWLSQRD